MSNKVIKGKVSATCGSCTIEPDGIHRESMIIVGLPIHRISLFVGQGYLGLFDLGVFYFSYTAMKYEYFVGSKTLKIIFNSDEI